MIWVVAIFAWMYLGWCIFIIYAGVVAKWDQMRPVLRLALVPIGVLGALMDVSFNWSVATLAFLDFPRELTLTRRLARYKAGKDGWRKDVGNWVCAQMLDLFQAGHC